MAFRYPLQSLLNLRQGLERQEEQKLLAAAAVVARLHHEIDQLEENQLQAQRTTLSHLAAGGAAAELQFASACAAAYERLRCERRNELQAAEAKRLERMHSYRKARQKREILEGMRERQQAAYELAFSRREQQSSDEAYLIRRFHDLSGPMLPSEAAESAQPEAGNAGVQGAPERNGTQVIAAVRVT
jgi:flagellar export protein FliJ